ncbi:MAG: hypothetical protein KDD09_22450, partial [Phaeodactylibacter sp.]|nr:hypothetical protein [Phaeodactylibacter sp.]
MPAHSKKYQELGETHFLALLKFNVSYHQMDENRIAVLSKNKTGATDFGVRACLEVVVWAANDRFWNLTSPFFRP